jgi:DNA-binding NtrC family response regulator
MNNTALAPTVDSTRVWNHAEILKQWDVLIVSARGENSQALLRILKDLPIHTFAAASVAQAKQVLSRHPVDLIFCEESLPDGSYRQLLELAIARNKKSRFVVILCTGEWDEYLEAIGLGVTDVLRCPLQSIDVELVLIGLGHDRYDGSEMTA